MNTIEKIDTTFMNANITASDVAGFRLFLRKNIYCTKINELADRIAGTFPNVINNEVIGNTICLYFYNSNVVSWAKSEENIVDSICAFLYSLSDQILNALNYDDTVTHKQKDAYKKILYLATKQRLYFEILINISYTINSISIML